MTAFEIIQKHKDASDNHLLQASKVATDEVERLARIVLQKCPFFTEFLMAMGVAFFSLDEKLECEEIWGLGFKAAAFTNPDVETCANELNDPPEELVALGKLICDWDEHLHMTGEPMRFTTDGEKITDW